MSASAVPHAWLWLIGVASIAIVSGNATSPASATAGDPKAEKIYGPPPDWQRFKQLGEAALRQQLPVANWQIEWPNGYAKAGWAHKGSVSGYLTCGILRTTEPVQGYYPLTNFAIVIDQDQVKRIDISDRARNSLVNVVCAALVNQGKLPPASLMTPVSATSPVSPSETSTISSLGLTIHPVPEGAYVTATTPGSRAERAGLKPGMVLIRVNGIALANMGPAMIAPLSARGADLIVETVTGDRHEMRGTP